MTMTSKGALRVGVVQDLAGIPQSEADLEIVARPLGIPQMSVVKLKDPNMVPRWVNRSDSESTAHHFTQMMYNGFVPVRPDEVDPSTPHGGVERDGKVLKGDLILCKMDKRRYLGALKYRDENAINRVRQAAGVKETSETVAKEVMQANEPASVLKSSLGKISVFQPSPEEALRFFHSDEKQK